MYFSPAVVLAFIAWGGLSQAATSDLDLSLERRGLDSRGIYIIKTNSNPFTAAPALPNTFRMMSPMDMSPLAQPSRQSNFLGMPSLPYTSRMQSSISPALLNNPDGFSVQETLTFKPNRPARPTRLINLRIGRPQGALMRLKNHHKGTHHALRLKDSHASLRKHEGAHRAILLRKLEAHLKKKLAAYEKKAAKAKAAKLKAKVRAKKLAHQKKLTLHEQLNRQRHLHSGSAKSLKSLKENDTPSKHHKSKDTSDWTSSDSSKKESHEKSSKATSTAKSIFDLDSDKSTSSDKSKDSSKTESEKPKKSDDSSSTGTSKPKNVFDLDSDKSKNSTSSSTKKESSSSEKRDESSKDRAHARSF